LGFIATVLFFLLDQKETKKSRLAFFFLPKIVMPVAEGAETLASAQTTGPLLFRLPNLPISSRQKKRGPVLSGRSALPSLVGFVDCVAVALLGFLGEPSPTFHRLGVALKVV